MRGFDFKRSYICSMYIENSLSFSITNLFCHVFVSQIFVPLLANPENHKNWADVVSLDVKEHVHSLKSSVYQVKGQISGKTILPMPVGVERLDSIEKTVKQRLVDLPL